MTILMNTTDYLQTTFLTVIKNVSVTVKYDSARGIQYYTVNTFKRKSKKVTYGYIFIRTIVAL